MKSSDRNKPSKRKNKKSLSYFGMPRKASQKKTELFRLIPPKRLWFYRMTACLIIPFLFFLLLEGALRLVGFGYPASAIIRQNKNTICRFHDNPKFGYRFFPKNVAREFTPFSVPAQKSPNAYRIVILGGSAAQGVPDPAFSFGRILEVMLQMEYPAIHFDVITAAMPAINSHVALEIARDCLRLQPDLFVVYMGNNEVIGPYGPGTVFSPFFSNLSLLRFVVSLKATKTAQCLMFILERIRLQKESMNRWQGMEMFLKKQIRFDDPGLGKMYRHFENNLIELKELSEQNGIPLICCTVGVNLKDCPPFTSLHRQTINDVEKENWESIYNQGVALEKQNLPDEAIHAYLTAVKIDSEYADLQFRLGRCYCQTDQYPQARERFEKARQLDTNRFRADDRINAIIRNVSEGNPVDAMQMFEKNSLHGIPGKELFLDHVHLNFKGNYLLARKVFDRINPFLPGRFQHPSPREMKNIGERMCAKILVYNEPEEYRITQLILNNFMKRPPFTNQLYHAETILETEKTLDSLRSAFGHETINKTVDEYEKAIENRPSDWWLHWKYAGLLASTDVGEYQEALRHYRFVQNFLPHYANAHMMLGLVLGKLNHLNESIALNQKAIEIDPTLAEAYFNLGLAHQMQGHPEKALAYYRKTLFYQAENPRAHNNMAVIYFKQGHISKAAETLKRGLLIIPEDIELHYNLAIILNRMGRKQEAIEELRHALQIDPQAVAVRNKLNDLSAP